MIAIVSAPTNLGLRPPEPGAVAGTAKAPEALREAGLHARLLAEGATDAGAILPGRYVDDPNRSRHTLRNHDAIVDHARRLAARLVSLMREGRAPLVLGGDCSLLVAAGLASRVARPGGLVHVDGHTDFRHPSNSPEIGALAGEDLAAAVGLHLPEIVDIDGLGPYFDRAATAHIGCRRDDEHLDELADTIGLVLPADRVVMRGAARAAADVLELPALDRGFWLQIDVDVLDPQYMPAVDSPDVGGLSPDELIRLLELLAPRAWGASVTVFDPDLDPTGRHARTVAEIVTTGLRDLGRDPVL